MGLEQEVIYVKDDFASLYDRTIRPLGRYLASHGAGPSDLPDLLQESYLAYFQLLERKGDDYPQNPEAVLFVIAKRILWRYRQGHSPTLPLEVEDTDGNICPLQEDALTQQDPSPALLDKITAERLMKQLKNAGPKGELKRRIFLLRFGCDLPLDQIAAVTGIGISGVKHLLYDTLNTLRATIREEEIG